AGAQFRRRARARRRRRRDALRARQQRARSRVASAPRQACRSPNHRLAREPLAGAGPEDRLSTEALLREIGARAYAAGVALDEKQRHLTLFAAGTPFDGTVRWTEYRRGAYQTTGGVARHARWHELGDAMK